jgi:hypothetical protein
MSQPQKGLKGRNAMKKSARHILFAFFILFCLASSLTAQAPRRGRFAISAFGGRHSGVGFLAGFTGSSVGLPGGGNIIPDYDSDTDGPLYQYPKADLFGFSIGYILGITNPQNERYWLSICGEFTYCPAVKFGDASETLSRSGWDQTQNKFVDSITTYSQTGRKAGMWGTTFGIVIMPFRPLPLGLEMGIGWWNFTQQYVSGTMQALEGTTDLTPVTNESAGTGLKYGGQGKLERNHSALALKVGLTYRILKCLSFDVAFRKLAYFSSYKSQLIYVDTGNPVRGTESHGLANLFTGGITFYF